MLALSDTNTDSLQVLSIMAPEQYRFYARGRSKSVTSSVRLVIGSDDERYPEYVTPGTATPSRDARVAKATPKKVTSGIVTAFQSNDEHTLTVKSSGSATHEKGESGSLEVLWSEEASGSAEVPAPATAVESASSDEANSSESTPVHQLMLSPRLPTSPTGGVSTGSMKSIPMQSSLMTKES